jgi:hypothetical protein
MNRRVTARQIVILMRDALGRFIRMRVTPAPKPRPTRTRRTTKRSAAVQLALF